MKTKSKLVCKMSVDVPAGFDDPANILQNRQIRLLANQEVKRVQNTLQFNPQWNQHGW